MKGIVPACDPAKTRGFAALPRFCGPDDSYNEKLMKLESGTAALKKTENIDAPGVQQHTNATLRILRCTSRISPLIAGGDEELLRQYHCLQGTPPACTATYVSWY
jgi:hypothetical protein